MKNLKDNDRVKIKAGDKMKRIPGYYFRGTVGTIEGFHAEHDFETLKVAMKRAVDNGHEIAWANLDCSVLSGDPRYYKDRDEKIKYDIELVDGEEVEIENRFYTVKLLGNYSDFIRFIPVK